MAGRRLWDDVNVPLSEDEQRILSQIEAQLHETDPSLAREVSSTTVYSKSFRSIRMAAVAFVAGVAAMVFTLSISYWLAFVGFIVMLGAALMLERNARELGKVGIDQVGQSLRRARVKENLEDSAQKLRDRLKRDDL